MTEYSDSTIARFWQKVDRRGPDECWEWTASTQAGGYGQFRVSRPRRKVRAHIMAYQISKGPTNGLLVCHSCDNPPCCNPQHLWLGTHDDNMKDAAAKKRFRGHNMKGEANPRAILKIPDVQCIREQIAGGKTNIAIAAQYGVTHSMISRIRLGKAWTHTEMSTNE